MAKITLDINSQKLDTLKLFIEKRPDADWETVSAVLKQAAQESFDKAFDKQFRKYVPRAVREYIQDTENNK